jgi:uncharacterized membrane protein
MKKNLFSKTRGGVLRDLRAYFIAGLLVLIPIYVTIRLTLWVYSTINNPVNRWIRDHTLIDEWFRSAFYSLAPKWLAERVQYEGHIPGLGFVITVLVILGIGLLGKNYLGNRLISYFEHILNRIPLISRIYKGAKQVSEVFLERNKDLFQGVVLVEYPRKGIWSMGFLTQTDSGEISEKLDQEMACVFISTTPNPTSGLLVILPKKDLLHLDMSIEEALKMVISGGLVTPQHPAAVRAGEFPSGTGEEEPRP